MTTYNTNIKPELKLRHIFKFNFKTGLLQSTYAYAYVASKESK